MSAEAQLELIAKCDALIRELGRSMSPSDRARAAAAYIDKGLALSALGRSDEELNAYRSVVEEYGLDSAPAIRVLVARALLNQVEVFRERLDTEAMLRTYEDLSQRFLADEDVSVQKEFAPVLVGIGVSLHDLGRYAEALEVFDEAIVRYSDAREPVFAEQLARAWGNKGYTLDAIGRADKALVAYDALLARFGASEEPELVEQVALGLANKARALVHLARPEEGFVIIDALRARFGSQTNASVRRVVLDGLLTKARILHGLEQFAETISCCDDLLGLASGQWESQSLDHAVAAALTLKSVAEHDLEQPERALETIGELLARFPDPVDPVVREQVAAARVNQAVMLEDLDRAEEARDGYEAVLEMFSEDETPTITSLVAWASESISRLELNGS